MGLKTNSSCGGHNDHRRPYIHFSGDQLKEVVALMQAWKEAGGVDYRMIPLGELATDIRIQPPIETPLTEAQQDLTKFAEFLRIKLGVLPTNTSTFGQIGSFVRKWFTRNI